MLGMVVIVLMALWTMPYVFAQEANWMTLLSIKDLTGNILLQREQPLLAGHSYNVTAAIDVPFTQSLSVFEATLDSRMVLVGSQFWYLATPNYGGYDPSGFTPGSRTVRFKQIQGKLTLSTLFSVPSDITTSDVEGLKLHFVKKDFQLVAVIVTGGSIVGRVAVKISNAAIETYLNTYIQKSVLLSAGKIDKAYSSFVDNVLQQSQALYQSGLPEKAASLLDIIAPESFPTPPNPSLLIGLIALGGALAVMAVILAVLLIRGRARYGYASGIVSGVQKELAALEVTVAQYDKALASGLKTIRDRLGEVL